ncbi:PEP-CTERM sorting domain-containing protein [Aquabacterium sp. A7-Y]|uniref:PEP-CTERM sorting domain-containing protein n=1 Tax=Aquabacterium sp. A7-Y TaxID=1349605 RepID=UPI00223DED74|nr:PEP-CTERM sorting domain-containing protein [Aquabacterium sp. A7-Y]MCW7541176.1 PEP-CTERM sorting domain-containing protein [Aquabacterium sp. A7-Y]
MYRDVNAYLAAVGGLHELITFEGGPVPRIEVLGDRFSNEMTFVSCVKPGSSCWQGPPTVDWFDNAIVSPAGGTQVRVVTGALLPSDTVHRVTTSMALGIYGDTTSASIGISFFDQFLDAFRLNGATGFFGIVSNEEFDAFEVGQQGHHEEVPPFFINGVAFPSPSGSATIDWPAAPIPEPSTSLLLTGGALMLLVRRRAVSSAP